MWGKRTKKYKTNKNKPKPKQASLGKDNGTSSGETNNIDAKYGNAEQLPNDDAGDVQRSGEDLQASNSKADKAKGEQKLGGKYHLTSSSPIEHYIPTGTKGKGKGKQRAEEVDKESGPKETRIDSHGPLRPHKNEAESAEWIKEHYGQDAQPSTQAPGYEIPALDRTPSYRRFTISWPRHRDNTLVPISEFRQLIQSIAAYSVKRHENKEWMALKPCWWLQMLNSICRQAEESAETETKRMERDLEHYMKIFPLQKGADFQWPMSGNEHWRRHEVRNLMVD
jgi:hypothetical protein